ncbi:MAG: amidohydrolase family protein [Nanohaloarchaea archaeon]|nr:amidohydrolase family protein [Candidatus Nanohaloarchaea archaeon]
MELLLKNCAQVLTQDKTRNILKDTDILIKDGIIKELGKNLSTAGKIIDCKDKLVMPGLINTHNHLAMSLFKGYGDDMPLDRWLQEKIWPAEAKLDDGSVRYGTLFALMEMIKTGTTCFSDMYLSSGAVLSAARSTDIRGFVAYGMIDLGNPEKTESEIKEANLFLKNFKSDKTGLIRPMLGPHSPYTCSRDLLEKTKKLARKNNLQIHIHVSETQKEIDDSIKAKGMRPVEYLNDIGFLDKNTIMAHACHLSEDEIALIKKSGARISHNPTSNMKLATGGAMPLKELMDAKIPVGLGTDGSASNNSLDLMGEMKVCALLHKFADNDPETASAQTVLDLATIGGAKVLGLEDKIGSIEIGKQADIILIDLNDTTMIPDHNSVSNIVYSATGSCVDTTIVNGKILMENKILTTIDQKTVIEKVKEFASKI